MLQVLLLLRACRAEPDIIIRDSGVDIDALLYGDLPKFDDLFLPPEGMEPVESGSDEEYDENVQELPADFDDAATIKAEKPSLDVTEFNGLVATVNNLTRRFRGWWKGYTDPDDKPKKLEFMKREKLDNMTLQFLVHARYHVKKAIGQKTNFRLDRRYKIGYLFNRMRRIKYEQMKLISVLDEELKLWDWRELQTTMRFYEKIVRYDVDLKDTILLIKAIDKEDRVSKDASITTSTLPVRKLPYA